MSHTLLLSLALASALALAPAPACAPGECCIGSLFGHDLSYCLVPGDPGTRGLGGYTLPGTRPPTVLARPNTRPNARWWWDKADEFTLNILNLNVWDIGEAVDERMVAIQELLKKSEYDVVLVQEAWYNTHYHLLASAFPYASSYGHNGSTFCPSVTRDEAYSFQLRPIDCLGLTVLSRWPIVHQEMVLFKRRIPWYAGIEAFKELVVQRGAMLSTLEVRKEVAGVVRELRVAVVNTHLATWYSATEEKWSGVREAQADEVLTLAEAAATTADLVLVGVDLNSSPSSAVFSKMVGAGLLDPLVELEGERSTEERFDTYGHSANTWTAAEDGLRIDYLLYKGTSAESLAVRALMYQTLDRKADNDSISDHMGVECQLTVTFN
jgi:endonuclease/exonuclease/phosphatase family metal-dependent hydrolase